MATEDVKHFKLRLPSKPDFRGDQDESYSLTKIWAFTEILSTQRYTAHNLICEIIEAAPARGFTLPVKKLPSIPTSASTERIDLRLNQKQIDAIDYLRDQLARTLTNMSVFDARGYYERYEVVRAILPQELARISRVFEESYFKLNEQKQLAPPMQGKPWKVSDDQYLSNLWTGNNRVTAEILAQIMGRGVGAILSRLLYLKLFPSLEAAQSENALRKQQSS